MYNWDQGRYSTVEEEEKYLRAYLPEELIEYYKTRLLDRVEIDGNSIQGYFEYFHLPEKYFNEKPERSFGGVLNLDNYTTFLTDHLILKFKYFHIEEYRKVIKLINSKNSFKVTFYDTINDCRVTREMHFNPPKMPLLHQMNLMIKGVKDFEIELVGTNRGLKKNTVTYDYNLKGGYTLYDNKTSATQEIPANVSDIIGGNATYKKIVAPENALKTYSDISLFEAQQGTNLIGDITALAKFEPSEKVVYSPNASDQVGRVIVGLEFDETNKICYAQKDNVTKYTLGSNNVAVSSIIGSGIGIKTEVMPGSSYTFRYNGDYSGLITIFYDASGDVISYIPQTQTFTTPSGCKYVVNLFTGVNQLELNNLSKLQYNVIENGKKVTYTFNQWHTKKDALANDKEDFVYQDGVAYFIDDSKTLYAGWTKGVAE